MPISTSLDFLRRSLLMQGQMLRLLIHQHAFLEALVDSIIHGEELDTAKIEAAEARLKASAAALESVVAENQPK